MFPRTWTCSSICKWFKYFLKLLQAGMHGAWWMLGNLHMFFLLVMEPKVMWNYTFAMQTFYAKLLFNLHWLKLFACWSYQRSRGVADPTFPRDLGTGARTSATCTAASSRSSGVGGFQCCGPWTSFWSWVMSHVKRENTHENTKSYLQDIATYSTAFLREIPHVAKQLGDCAAILVIHDIHNTSSKKETGRFWRKFDIRVT